MEILKIGKSNLKPLAAYLSSKKSGCNELLREFQCNVEKYQIDENISKYVIRNYSEFISAVIVDCKSTIINQITFYGLLDVTYKQIEELYGIGRVVYVPYDEGEHVFFNEDKINGDYSVKYLIVGTEKVSTHWEDKKLENLSIIL